MTQYLHYQLSLDNPGKWASEPIDESDAQDTFIEILTYLNVPYFVCPSAPFNYSI